MAESNTQATEPNQEQQTQAKAAPNYDEIFGKLDAILDKRADGLAKSALKDNGVDETEIADIVKAYREQKAAKATEQAAALTGSQARIAELEKKLVYRDMPNSAHSNAALWPQYWPNPTGGVRHLLGERRPDKPTVHEKGIRLALPRFDSGRALFYFPMEIR